jgi:hypothetical protein
LQAAPGSCPEEANSSRHFSREIIGVLMTF